MIFKARKHNSILYNTLLTLSRNIFFYKILNFKDTYETRIYLMFLHYSVILFSQKIKGNKPDQINYNNLFFFIENNLRELGFGDVSVNKKMKDLNKIFYDILIKLSEKQTNLKINQKLLDKYFEIPINELQKREKFALYLNNFYKFCFELPTKNMIEDLKNFKF